jgi:hypothetical protein
MRSQMVALRVAGAIFALFCLGQFIRLVVQPELIVAGHEMPLWPSAVAVAVFAGLSAWMWSLARTAR